VNASAAFSRDDYKLRRRMVYAGFNQTATAAPSGKRTDVAVNAGYPLRAGEWAVTPTLGLLNSRWQLNDFAESDGGAASLDFAGWRNDSLRSRAGIEIARRSALGKFSPSSSVMWLHDFEEKRGIPARLAAAGSGFISPGRPAEKDLVQANLALNFQMSGNVSLYGGFGRTWGKNVSVNADFSAGLHWTF
jgi:outer membrane autotransporter protein